MRCSDGGTDLGIAAKFIRMINRIREQFAEAAAGPQECPFGEIATEQLPLFVRCTEAFRD